MFTEPLFMQGVVFVIIVFNFFHLCELSKYFFIGTIFTMYLIDKKKAIKKNYKEFKNEK